MTNTIATWDIQLVCKCPECEATLDAMSCEVLDETPKIQIGKGANNINIRCTYCDWNFVIDIQGTNKRVQDIIMLGEIARFNN
jgi:hypothetical protein